MAQVNHNNQPSAYGSGELKIADNKKVHNRTQHAKKLQDLS